jgi:putative transposase
MAKIPKKARAVKAEPEELEKTISEQGLLSFAMAEFARVTLTDAVERLCAQMKGAHGWGEEQGYVRAGLIRVPITRPRVRADGREVAIPEYELLQRREEFDEATRRSLMGGLTTRQFERVGEALGRKQGLSKSTVSRVSKSFAKDFEKLMSQECKDIAAVLIDGIHFTDELCVIAALGVSQFGTRRLLGLWAGTTESREVVGAMFDELKDRELNPKLFVIDGSKGLRSAIEKKFPWVAVQRCQLHKKRNIFAHLEDKHHAWAAREMTAIFKASSVAVALDRGRSFSRELGRINESARRSWDEAFPETITILQVDNEGLRKTLSTTNPIESLFSVIRSITGRVKRWRTASQALYWCAGSYFRVEKRLRRIRGFRGLDQLTKVGQKIETQAAQAAA